MKRLLLLFAALIGFSAVASAQIGYNDVQFYVEAGQSWDTLSDYGTLHVVTSNDGKIGLYEITKTYIKGRVSNNSQCLYSPQMVDVSHGHVTGTNGYKKDYKYSTSSEIVYCYSTSGSVINHGWGIPQTVIPGYSQYFSLSPDGKVLKYYYNEEKGDSYSTYIRIDKNDLKPKASNSEFYD